MEGGGGHTSAIPHSQATMKFSGVLWHSVAYHTIFHKNLASGYALTSTTNTETHQKLGIPYKIRMTS
jgi:hypothetical protein